MVTRCLLCSNACDDEDEVNNHYNDARRVGDGQRFFYSTRQVGSPERLMDYFVVDEHEDGVTKAAPLPSSRATLRT